MMDVWKRLESIFENIRSKLNKLSFKKVIIILFVLWFIIYIPATYFLSVSQVDDLYAFYPEDAAPDKISYKDYEVVLSPNGTLDSDGDRLKINVSKGEELEFNWTAKDYDSPYHIGRVSVHYELEGEKGIIRLREQHPESGVTTWKKEHTFKEEGTLKYYFRVDKNDISTFHRRASVILEGGNLYKDVRTGPPPLISFFFVIPTLLTPSVALGGAYLSFTLFFSIFVLIDTFIIFYMFKNEKKSNSILLSLMFLLNPITISNIHQDESIIAFTLLIPLYFLIKNREKVSSFFTGMFLLVKFWTVFLLPLFLLNKKKKIISKVKNISIIAGTAMIGLFGFVLLYGEKVLWFLRFYSGTAEKTNVTRLSFWPHWLDVFGMVDATPPTALISLLIGIIFLFIFCFSMRKDWGHMKTITLYLLVFFALYPKIHWSYFIILFPFMFYYGASELKYFLIDLVVIVIMYLMMIVASSPFSFSDLEFALLTTVLSALLLFNGGLIILDERDEILIFNRKENTEV